MPKIIQPIPDVTDSVTRPVTFDILRRLFKDLGMSTKTLIFFPDTTGVGKQPGTSIDAQNKDVATFPHASQVVVEVDEVYEHSSLLAIAVFRPEHPFIMRDDDLEVGIKPVYTYCETSLSFKYTARDKSEAMRWRDDFRGRIAMMRDDYLMNIKYYYLYPLAFLEILKEIHRLREETAGYGDDYEKYFREHVTPKTTKLVNQAGYEGRLAVAEGQKRVIGWWDVDGMPEQGSKEGEGETWTISMTFKFAYQRPIECAMMYPLVIHNQMVDQKFRNGEKPYRLTDTEDSHSLSTSQFAYFEAGNAVSKFNTLPGVAIPDYDEFSPSNIIPGTMRLFTVLITIDQTNPLLLFNLKDLGEHQLDPSVIKYLEADHMNLHRPRWSLINVSLYQGPALMNEKFLRIDKDLNVYSTEPLNLRAYHHVRVSIVTRLSDLPPEVIDKARDHGDTVIKIIDAGNPDVKDRCGLPKLVNGNYISRREMERVSDCIDTDLLNKGNGNGYHPHYVGILFVESYKYAHSQPNQQSPAPTGSTLGYGY